MRGFHHGAQGGIHRALRIGEESCHAGEGLVGLRIEDMKDGADEERMAGFFPVIPFVQRAFGVDEDVGNVLDVAHLPLAAAHLEQRIVGRGLWVGWVEEQHAAMACPETRGKLPVLALDVVDDGRAGPGQQRRHHQADALARTCRGKAQHMLRSIMAQILAIIPAKDDTIGIEQAGRLHLGFLRPSRRAIGGDVLRLARAPD